MKIGFIGAGKVGFSLGKYLQNNCSQNDVEIVGYFSKSLKSAKSAATTATTAKAAVTTKVNTKAAPVRNAVTIWQEKLIAEGFDIGKTGADG